VVDQKNTDQVVVGSLMISLEIRLLDANGAEVWKDLRSESASFTTTRGESFRKRPAEGVRTGCPVVVAHLEKQW